MACVDMVHQYLMLKYPIQSAWMHICTYQGKVVMSFAYLHNCQVHRLIGQCVILNYSSFRGKEGIGQLRSEAYTKLWL